MYIVNVLYICASPYRSPGHAALSAPAVSVWKWRAVEMHSPLLQHELWPSVQPSATAWHTPTAQKGSAHVLPQPVIMEIEPWLESALETALSCAHSTLNPNGTWKTGLGKSRVSRTHHTSPEVERNRNQNEPKMSDLHAATAFQPPKQDLLNHLRGVRHLKAAQLWSCLSLNPNNLPLCKDHAHAHMEDGGRFGRKSWGSQFGG